MTITMDPRTERDLALIVSEYERRGAPVTPTALIEEIVDALQKILRAEQPSQFESNLTDEERAILEEGGFDLTRYARSIDPLRRTQIKLATLIADSFTTAEAAKVLGVTPSRIRQMLSAHELFGIRWRGEWRVPRFQFDDNHLVPYVGHIFQRLDPAMDVIGLFNWFTLPNDDLRDGADREVAPRDWLIAGGSWERVAEQAPFL